MPQVDQDEQELLDPVERKVPVFLRVELYIPLILIAGISLAVLLYAQGMIGAGWTFGQKPESVLGAFSASQPPVPGFKPELERTFVPSTRFSPRLRRLCLLSPNWDACGLGQVLRRTRAGNLFS